MASDASRNRGSALLYSYHARIASGFQGSLTKEHSLYYSQGRTEKQAFLHKKKESRCDHEMC